VGNNALGGRDWDALVEQYLYEEFLRVNGRPIPDDPQRHYEVQQLALEAKFALSEHASHAVSYAVDDGELACTLHRSAPPDRDGAFEMDDADHAFYFEERATELLQRCQTICEAALEERLADGTRRRLAWADIDEVVLAGGACRMPMIPAMLERMSGRKVRPPVAGFDFDTAIASGAALYGLHRARVTDVVAHGLGVRVLRGGRGFVDYLVEKGTPQPVARSRTYRAPASARLEVYEGASYDPDDCSRRGELALDNPDGYAAVEFALDTNGILRVAARYPVDGAGGALPGGPPPARKELEVRHDLFRYDRRAELLREKVQSLTINW
jgi:molecular chaperone DnaK